MATYLFESIAKTNTTHTSHDNRQPTTMFESIAKTNTTHTVIGWIMHKYGLRVLLKQIQHTPTDSQSSPSSCLRVLLKQIQHTLYPPAQSIYSRLRVLLKQIQHTGDRC